VLNGTVCVAIVTYNSGRYIRRCLEAVLRQKGVPLEIVVVDNASTDGTLEILKEFGRQIRILRGDRNVGFAEAQNRAIRSTTSEWVFTLNPDVLLRPGFIRRLVDAGESDPGVGTVCGKLFSIGPGFQALPEPRIDSTGIYFTPAMRHFDRGWHEPDRQRFEHMEYVFGATAAAALYRRKMIEDVSLDGEFFDPDFFIYREDADVAWRALLMGWRCIYTPGATAYHVRTVTPGNRRSLPAVINMHSVKNRFLMRIKNATGGLYRRHWLAMTLRDLVVVGGCLFWEPTSLAAFWHVARLFPRALARRRAIMRRRRVGDAEMAQWFAFRPAAIAIDEMVEAGEAEPGVAASGPRRADPLPAADYVA
jgi:GT2 family glycosyltransferase